MRGGEQWRDVPGFNGWYQASNLGRIRSFRPCCGKPRETPIILKPTVEKKGDLQIVIQLGSGSKDSKQRSTTVPRMVYAAWNGPIPERAVVRHLDGRKDNNTPDNLFLVSFKDQQSEVAKRGGGHNRRPVVKINRSLEVVAAYRSAAQAARENNFQWPQTIVRICNFGYKSAPFASDGFLYAWDEDRCIRKAIRLAMEDMDRRGERYTDPFTEEYYNLPPDPADGIDLDAIQWTDAP